MKRQEERLQQSIETNNLNSRDFLSRFIDAMEKDPSIPKWALPAWTSSNILAGSDTTAIYLRTMFKNLLEYPKTLERLRSELQEAASSGRLSMPVTWKESRQLPYLDACIKEAGRIHSPFGLPLERVVPSGGLSLCGEYIKEGTVVGMSAWVVHRDKAIFGEDADSWRPERWLGSEEGRRKMEQSLLTFGAGHRSCLGKHISLLEIYKLVPTILQEYDVNFHPRHTGKEADLLYQIELLDPERAWHVENRWFVPQFGLQVQLSKREHKFRIGKEE
jgi:cytochrome P450